MKNEPKKSSGLPLAIIVLVLIFVVIGGYWFYNSSSKKPVAGNTNRPANTANTAKTARIPTNAPPGAQPPNMLGTPTALVTVEEFADFQCGSCAAAHSVMKEIQSAYAGNKNFRFIFRHYPLPSHDKSYEAATAAEAAGMQGSTRFWAMQNELFTSQQAWTANQNYRQLWSEYAAKIGLDVAKFQADTNSITAKGRVNLDIDRGKALGVSSTPTVYVNGRSIPFTEVNAPSMRQIIDAELQNAATAAPANAPAAGNANAANSK